MNSSSNRNFVAYPAEIAWERFSGYVSGSRAGLLAVVSSNPLGSAAVSALNSTAHQLGYGPECAFLSLHAPQDAPQPSGSPQADTSSLTPKTLFEALELLDPLAIVAADSQAAAALSRTYGAEVAPMRASRLLGRTCVAFVQFENMLDTPSDKQTAWRALKLLPNRA